MASNTIASSPSMFPFLLADSCLTTHSSLQLTNSQVPSLLTPTSYSSANLRRSHNCSSSLLYSLGTDCTEKTCPNSSSVAASCSYHTKHVENTASQLLHYCMLWTCCGHFLATTVVFSWSLPSNGSTCHFSTILFSYSASYPNTVHWPQDMSNSFEWVSISSCSWFPLLFHWSVDIISLFPLILHSASPNHTVSSFPPPCRHCSCSLTGPSWSSVALHLCCWFAAPNQRYGIRSFSQGHKWVICWSNVDVGLPRHTSLRLG